MQMRMQMQMTLAQLFEAVRKNAEERRSCDVANFDGLS